MAVSYEVTLEGRGLRGQVGWSQGKYVFTVGGADLTLNQWAVNTESMATVSSLAKVLLTQARWSQLRRVLAGGRF